MMDKRMDRGDSANRPVQDELIEVVYARSIDEAERFCGLLEDNRIPSQFDAAAPASEDNGVAVLVPDRWFNAASEILAMAVDDDEEDADELEDDDDEFDDDYDDDDDFDDDDEGAADDEE